MVFKSSTSTLILARVPRVEKTSHFVLRRVAASDVSTDLSTGSVDPGVINGAGPTQSEEICCLD